jgi:hypothetical protein
MRRFRLDRRTFLRGAAGIAVGLPMLEAMAPARADELTPPKRFSVSWGGISLAGYGPGGMVVPAGTGKGYEITRGLQSLADLGVADAVTIVSGLLLPWQENGGAMPPAGRTPEFHFNTLGPQIAGTPTGPGRDGAPKGPTADQIVADFLAEDTKSRVLSYRVQPASYVGSNEIGGDAGRMSWKNEGGSLEPVDPTVSPRVAYQSLFTGFTPPDPADAAAAELELRRNKSVLDIVDRRADGLLGKLGAADRIRMERHLDEIRALEKRLDAVQPTVDGCELLPDPGDDPPIGDAIIEYEGEGQPYSTTAGYSNEDLRADLLTDYIRMAFVCDLSRVASFMLTEWKCYMNMFNFGGWESDMHELTHYAGPEESVADAVGFHLKQFARLAKKLRDSPEIDGSTILDHSALVLILEGGWGWDPEGGDNSTHSTENMACFVAGGAGGLRQGEHIVAANKHPGQVVLTAMQAVGHAGGLGELTQGLPAMLV